MGNKDLKIQDSEFAQVSKLLGDLTRVDAPNDFDFRVRARIAEGKPAERTATWLPASVRFALPLALLLLAGGYIAFNALYSPNYVEIPAVADVGPTSVPPIIDSRTIEVVKPSNEVIADKIDVRSPENGNSFLSREPQNRIVTSVPKTDRPGGGSLDAALTKGRQIYPRGLNPNGKILVKPKEFEQNAQVSAKDLFSLIGIEAKYTSSSWTIDAVRPDSVADRAGVKAGDAIEAVNDQTLTEKTTFGNGFSGKSLRIRRDGRSMTIDLKP